MKTQIILLVVLLCGLGARQSPAEPAGDLISADEAQKRLVALPRVTYPYEAMRQKITGSGVVAIKVDNSGRVISARMRQGTGSSILDNAATSTARNARYRPGRAFSANVPMTYTLSNGPKPRR